MTDLLVRPGGPLRGRATVPGDKSISHRALIFNALARGKATVRGLLDADDIASTRACLGALGVTVADQPDGAVRIEGRALRFDEPAAVLDCGNSGTTMRLLCGLLAGQPFHAVLTGDASLRRRPMARITKPLSAMGAHIDGRCDGALAPLSIRGGVLANQRLHCEVASAQARTALLLAGLQGVGRLEVLQPAAGRDHSERLLRAMGVPLEVEQTAGRYRVATTGPQLPEAVDVDVPGDFSSAAFLLVGALLVAGSSVVLESVGLNPGRTGLLDVLVRMGADIVVLDRGERSGEPRGDLAVRHSALHGAEIGADEVPSLVDEIPVLAVAAATAEGTTIISGAGELRHKESDRIAATVALVTALGGRAEARPDGMIIEGRPGGLRGNRVDAAADHRLAMAAAVAGLVATGETRVSGARSIATSFPQFPAALERLRA